MQRKWREEEEKFLVEDWEYESLREKALLEWEQYNNYQQEIRTTKVYDNGIKYRCSKGSRSIKKILNLRSRIFFKNAGKGGRHIPTSI